MNGLKRNAAIRNVSIVQIGRRGLLKGEEMRTIFKKLLETDKNTFEQSLDEYKTKSNDELLNILLVKHLEVGEGNIIVWVLLDRLCEHVSEKKDGE
jgi:hypothetical protein